MRKLFGFISGLFVVILSLIGLLVWSGSENKPQQTVEDRGAASLTEVERFAENNNISVELAESIEAALQSVSYGRRREYSLNLMYSFEQQENWSGGERYKVWADMEYIWTIYVKDDEVVSIRDSHMTFIYDVETK